MAAKRAAIVDNQAAPAERPASWWLEALGVSHGDSVVEMRAAADQVRACAFALPWLCCAHLLAGLALIASQRHGPIGPMLVLSAMLAVLLIIDLAVMALTRSRWIARMRPSRRAWLIAAYALWVGIGWIALTLAAPVGGAALHAAVALALVAGLFTFAAVPAAGATRLIPALILLEMDDANRDVQLMFAIAGLLLLLAMLAMAHHRMTQSARRAAAERAALKAGQLIAEFEENGRGWFWETDARGNLTYISTQLAEAIGQTVDRLLGKPFTALIMAQADGGDAERTLGFHLSTRLAFVEISVRAALEGEPRYWSLSGRPASDEFGNFLGFRGNGTDLTERRRSEAEIHRLARYDALTGLPNRLLMRQTLEAAMVDPQGRTKQCGLFLLDLDRFKTVNDTLGHPIGDMLLRCVAERLQNMIGDTGQVGRLGGDEFKVVLPDIDDPARLRHIADSVIGRLSQPYLIEGHHVSIGASVGVAIAPKDGATPDSLIRNADLALYAAKAAGKGVCAFYRPEMHANAQQRQLLEVDLRNVLGAGGLSLVYQPVVSAASERIVGFEALARWIHPTRGAISPSEFIPVAEEIGLIPQIGEWVIRTACAEAATWPDPVRVAVNISPIQFANPQLPSIIMSALAASQLPPQRLELEITEGVFLNDDAATDTMFARLKAIGVRFALDDFGTGYSSLGYLRKAPFNKIKIDQSFVRGAAVPGNRNAAIIKAIVSLAESLDMDTTAEGAETHDELELIRSLGCSHIQGYIFGRPMPAEEARKRAQGGSAVVATGFLASRSPRVAMLRSATMRRAGTDTAVRVRNLSATGAMIETASQVIADDRVEILFTDVGGVAGTVRWTQPGRFGVAFDRNFPMELLNPAKPGPQLKRAG